MITTVHHDLLSLSQSVSVLATCSNVMKHRYSHAPMFVARRVARLTTLRHFPPGKRQFTSSIYDGFLDLAIALPWPSSFPPYSSTIILLAVTSRLALTVPFSVWVCLLQSSQVRRVTSRFAGEETTMASRGACHARSSGSKTPRTKAGLARNARRTVSRDKGGASQSLRRAG